MYLASTSDRSLQEAGEWGLGSLVLGFGGPEEIARKNQIYREAVKRRTPESQIPDVPLEHFAALCPAIVMEDGMKARAIGHRGQRFFAEAISYWYQPGAPAPRPEIADMDDAEVLQAAGEQFVAYLNEEKIEVTDAATGLYNPNHAYGTSEDAIGYVQRLIDAGADEIMFLIQMGPVPQAAALETIERIGNEVIPHFRG